MAEYRIVDEAFPSIIINRRARTQKKMGKILYDMTYKEDFDLGVKGVIRETGAGAESVRNNLGPHHKMIKNKKVYILQDWLKEDIKHIARELEKTEVFKNGLARDKKKLINVMFYILFLHNN